MDVTLHRGHDNPGFGLVVAAFELFRLHVRQQVGHSLLHYAGAFHHLGQKHLARAEQITYNVHSCHERAFDNRERTPKLLARLLGVRFDVFDDALHERVREPLFHRALAPGVFSHPGLVPLLHRVGKIEQALSRVRTAVQQYILNQFQQVLGNLFVDVKLAGVDDAHVHAGTDGVVKESRMHRLAHRVVAAKGKRDVTHPATHFAAGQGGLDDARRFNKGDRVVVVLLDAGAHSKDVGVKDDVLWPDRHFLGQDPVGAGRDLYLALDGVRLAPFVEGHNDHGRSIALDEPGVLLEDLFAFLQADGVHHTLALDALQPRFNHAPLRAVNYDGDAGDVRFGGDEVEESSHRLLGVEEPLVHIDVDHLRAALHLLARHRKSFFVLAPEDQPGKLGRTGDVSALADVDKVGVRPQSERFQPAEARVGLRTRERVRLDAAHRLSNGADMRGGRATAAPHDVHPAVRGKLAEVGSHALRCLVEAAQSVRQPGVGITTDIDGRDLRELLHVRPHLLRA